VTARARLRWRWPHAVDSATTPEHAVAMDGERRNIAVRTLHHPRSAQLRKTAVSPPGHETTACSTPLLEPIEPPLRRLIRRRGHPASSRRM